MTPETAFASYAEWMKAGMPKLSSEQRARLEQNYLNTDPYRVLQRRVVAAEHRATLAESKLAEAVKALEEISTWRKDCHAYDDDHGHARRVFDRDDVAILGLKAQNALASIRLPHASEAGG